MQRPPPLLTALRLCRRTIFADYVLILRLHLCRLSYGNHVKEHTILLSGVESNHTLSYASRAVPFGTCKVHSRYPLASLPTSTQEPQNLLRGGKVPIGAAKHLCSVLGALPPSYSFAPPRYSVGSLPVAPPRVHQYEGRSLQVTSSPLCCEVGNRTRHAAKCYHSATHYRHTHNPGFLRP